eukprot:XP_001690188.1 beta-amylase [Chlamydomonas reinhardtii]
MDFWWGAVERSPGQYNWSGYKQALEVIKQTGLKVQVVLSFHACGGNVGDTVQIPLPDWVVQCAEADPDLFFADRPRNGGLGNRNREYLSIWADDAPGVLRGRSPMQCYEEYMVSLRENFSQELGTVIDEVVVGAGPCGELRLPSYVEANGWRFPGAGEFQCYDRRALASLAQAAREAGHPEWGYTGPHDAGEYNSTPEHTGFFSHNGSWNTPYGRFFLEWYSGCLLKHGDRLLTVANAVGGGAGAALYGATGMHLALKIAGIHWWYRSRSHAAELTAGYYNVDGHDGYEAIVNLCARHRANLVLTCVEMCDSQHPAQAQCGPEGLLRQLRQLAARAGVQLSGENALVNLNGAYSTCLSPAPPEVLPSLRAFTFLRLVPEMLLPGYQSLWMRFMGKLLAS